MNTPENEIWRSIPSFAGYYEASSLGRIRRLGGGYGSTHGRVRRHGMINSGYAVVDIHIRRVVFRRLVHRLVAEAFLGPCPSGMEVNHKNCDKTDNRPENLEYITRSENLLHAVALKGNYRGTRNGSCKITEDLVRSIRLAHDEGMGYKKLSQHFGLSWGLVRSVATRKTWGWLD